MDALIHGSLQGHLHPTVSLALLLPLLGLLLHLLTRNKTVTVQATAGKTYRAELANFTRNKTVPIQLLNYQTNLEIRSYASIIQHAEMIACHSALILSMCKLTWYTVKCLMIGNMFDIIDRYIHETHNKCSLLLTFHAQQPGEHWCSGHACHRWPSARI